MANYAFYDHLGMVTQVMSTDEDMSEETIIKYTEAGINIKKVDDINKYFYIDEEGNVVDIPARPSKSHNLDPSTKTWVFDEESFLSSVRIKRNKLLSDSDYVEINSYYSALVEEKKQQWTDYRQALRDITKQSDIANLVWPVLPS